MNSPLVRRKRLASEVRALREAQGLNHEQLGSKAGFHRLKISRLETGERAPNVTDVMKILTALGVEGDRWHELVKIAEEASERGWWAEYGDHMGSRQRIYADLEAGATSIRTYEIFAVPGLLQIPEYMRERGVQTQASGKHANIDRNIEARGVRQQMFRRPGGPTYEVILDEPAIRRLSASPQVMAAQLSHLGDVAANSTTTSIRVLTVDARIPDYELPRSPFSLFEYADPGDPLVAIADTETTDLVFTRTDDVAPYVHRYERIREAALSVEDSIDLIRGAAGSLAAPASRE